MEEDLEELMEEFGPLNYCRIVIDPKTDHSRGNSESSDMQSLNLNFDPSVSAKFFFLSISNMHLEASKLGCCC